MAVVERLKQESMYGFFVRRNEKKSSLCSQEVAVSGSSTVSGAPNVNFRKISVRKTICDLEFSEHL